MSAVKALGRRSGQSPPILFICDSSPLYGPAHAHPRPRSWARAHRPTGAHMHPHTHAHGRMHTQACTHVTRTHVHLRTRIRALGLPLFRIILNSHCISLVLSHLQNTFHRVCTKCELFAVCLLQAIRQTERTQSNFEPMKVLDTINPHPTRAVHDGRYRREHSAKSWSQSRGQRANRAKLKADALHDAYECAWERRDERRAERKRRRAS